MKSIKWFSLSVAVSVFVTGAAAEVVGDPERGQQVYKKCASCHMVGPEARNRVGPVLNNILSARAAGVPEFKYSEAIKEAAQDGLHWTAETLDAFLQDPKQMVPRTKMSFRGLKSEEDRIDVIAYLASFSGGAMAAQVDEGFVISADILAIEGDVEYGEYLSSECTTCHQESGSDDGIPAIVGWETDDFVTAMHAYKQKNREHPVMQMVTSRLSNEEIAALAAYFKSLEN
ncbi:c-type cytochrome [uncultured Tateyamaria sp.]|uniref:c-type cytochrome n=1 Tax=uncultured Tateyamaria sp. TaxID=455651 RepID=UPI002634839E|nr:c-type cytochrome [uncultured Tateyamaria sp.]